MLCLREVLEPCTLHRDFEVDPKVGHSGAGRMSWDDVNKIWI